MRKSINSLTFFPLTLLLQSTDKHPQTTQCLTLCFVLRQAPHPDALLRLMLSVEKSVFSITVVIAIYIIIKTNII